MGHCSFNDELDQLRGRLQEGKSFYWPADVSGEIRHVNWLGPVTAQSPRQYHILEYF